MTRTEALAYIRLHTDTQLNPALTEAEEAVIDQSRVADATGNRIGDALYVDTICGHEGSRPPCGRQAR